MAARRLLTIILTSTLLLSHPMLAYAEPASDNYKLPQYDFGGGGTAGSESDGYSLFGVVGQGSGDDPEGATYKLGEGLAYAMMANQPGTPAFTNPATNYDRLQFVINNANNPSDATYSIAISTDNFVTTRYIQNDNTIGNALGSEDWQTYANWGGASGEFVTGLTPNTTYKIKVKARHGNFTESGYSTEDDAATVNPSLTFGVNAHTVTFNGLNAGNSYTDDTQATTLTTSTNAYNGYIIYGRETQALTHTTSPANTIPDYPDPNSAPTTWSGTGFGYTTSDTALSGGTGTRFSGGKYAGFSTSSPGDPVADHTDVVESSPISNEQFTISYRVTAQNTTPAGEYRSTIVYVIVPTY